MKAAEVRARFTGFFEGRGHERVQSSGVIPQGDPTLLFTNAGMNQFKDVFVGKETRAYKRATTSQKCLRAGGKHNDLDEVGKTARHHTFFEMLGNFSFGDYFKENAIAWAWELLTREFGLPEDRLIITVHRGDESLGLGLDQQARDIWQRVTGFGPDRVLALGSAENFWVMGETGPMGPCSEIHYYTGSGTPKVPAENAPPSAWENWLELWNLVFMQYERREAGGPLHPLPAPSIDTGAGLERLASVVQGVHSNYDTDLFQPLVRAAADAAGKTYGDDAQQDVSMRVIADHARSAAFLIAEGVFPEKTSREYVLRRIFRRAVRHGKRIGIEEPFMHRICGVVVAEMAEAFPELLDRKAVIEEVTLEEEKRFRATLDRGLGLLEDEFSRLRDANNTKISGKTVFQLYDTFGFPDDLTEIIAEENGFSIDREGYNVELDQARARSRFSGSDESAADIVKALTAATPATEFVGYDSLTASSRVLAMARGNRRVDESLVGDEVQIVFDVTPFYGESGGQVGDSGLFRGPDADVRISDTAKPDGNTFVHRGTVERGTLRVGSQGELAVDRERRQRIRANHSATHLLHRGLKNVLGDHVAQKGSLVTDDRLRFDFTHFSAVTEEQILEIEDWVNQQIQANKASVTDTLPLDEARRRGAVAMFGEKYGDSVRVVSIGTESLEFCGGTHVARSGDIGLFKITTESGVAQGVRRIEAVSHAGAITYLRKLESELRTAGRSLRAAPFEVAGKVERMIADQRKLEREIEQLKQKVATGGSRDLLADAVEISGVRVIAQTIDVHDAKTLRDAGDRLRDRMGSGVVVLAGTNDDKVNLVAMVTKDLSGRIHAGKLLQKVADVVDGRGGGRADMAQGGGKNNENLPRALQAAVGFVRDALG